MSQDSHKCHCKSPTDRSAGPDVRDPPRSDGGVALCGACRDKKTCRLGLISERLDETGTAWFELRCPKDHEGGPNVAHGGWTASVLDECLGHVPLLQGVLSVTAELAVSFIKPVPIERPVEVRARIERREGSRIYISGEMVLLPGRAVLARGKGTWIARDRTHFAHFENWLAEQDSMSGANQVALTKARA
ncbi:PaaI family thioesterase [Aromatoleum petrolei]|uniref:Acyl-coenzyme A thioesterase THEM4 n=1 Tax=Aromatoleum petrolei TaxID=76116 RepID=A0ABX1MPT1_9RHOO|nr:PaaI family thioesterase [Aromatoleum petrolei]QTQ34636.1 Thioesterase [Aromatoleum petrolei]